ncbi:MarC family protein [Cerasicoccus frondis]|uniref:MarC family protein n=1 Tax=Cerasicoccus frondis TaxID=490090 RepID=UPI0028528130|nr:NAAT family transporter [Cerasicoccus frondis]
MSRHDWLENVFAVIEYFFFAFVSLFVIISPISTVPLFLGMTPDNTPEERVGMARFACILAGCVLLTFAILGELLFNALGITQAAFQTAGGLLIFLIAVDMVLGKDPAPSAVMTPEDKAAGLRKNDIAITPLAIPMISGPGSISTAVLLQSKAIGWAQYLALALAIAAVSLASYTIFRFAAFGGRWLNPLILRIAKRLMGLLLAAVAVQFVFNGVLASGLFPKAP